MSFEFVHISQVMAEVSGFIEVTCISDGEKMIIRTDSIVAVYANPETNLSWGVKPRYTTIEYSGNSIDVIEDYEEVKNKMWRSDL